jgi:predicted phosphate transport protein (TIGR00153 family)
LSELIKWFEKRRETKVVTIMQQHLATTISAVEDLERAVKAAADNDEKKMKQSIARVTSAEKEADKLRRDDMRELARGELPPVDREDLMHLMKRIDMVADWSRESTRILSVISPEDIPDNLKKAMVEMMKGTKECAVALRRCVSRMTEKPEDALKAADEVERLEEEVDALHENARKQLAKETQMKVGVAIMLNQLLEAIETVADWCENVCDQVRVIVVRR